MKVTVKLISYLSIQAGFSEKEFEIPSGSTVKALLDRIQLKTPLAKVIIRNGRSVKPEEKLEKGDRIVISPVFSGG
ncbi:MAG: MoaD/ThiS family protein [Acidobacteriota bacterium]